MLLMKKSEPRLIGINTATAAVFIAGEMAGSGVLALPRALVDAGKIKKLIGNNV